MPTLNARQGYWNAPTSGLLVSSESEKGQGSNAVGRIRKEKGRTS